MQIPANKVGKIVGGSQVATPFAIKQTTIFSPDKHSTSTLLPRLSKSPPAFP